MSHYVTSIQTYFAAPDTEALKLRDLGESLDAIFEHPGFQPFLQGLIEAPVFSPDYGREFSAANAVRAISPCRMLRGALNLPLQHFFQLLGQAATVFASDATAWLDFADRLHASRELADLRLATYLVDKLDNAELNRYYARLIERLIVEHPHAIYPTSPYRECDGHIENTSDLRSVEAVMSFRTFASIHMTDHILDKEQRELRDIYRPLGRCVSFIDQNVHALYGDRIKAYFHAHGIPLEMFVYRAMEADKGLTTVERMLGDLKRIGIARNEPVLIVGGGVLADTGGLACALYGRNTPYVMLATSIVSGIDAGPSPRTCCDGFGYKNLLGAYHPPAAFFVDRFFFGTLHEGWLRHGVAEIIKIAAVRNAELFADLEKAQFDLISTRFGTVNCTPDAEVHRLSQNILGGAMKSYIESEYDNLYETHQCRPHAYGHTWSPGFEIAAGLLHGHAVAIDMGFGAYLSMRAGWIDRIAFDRILGVISGYGLSLWHDILNDDAMLWESHRKIIQKRGGNLVAPLPKNAIGECGYLNTLSRAELFVARDAYKAICASYIRGGRGIDPLCSDVGLEDPSTVMAAAL